jgi:hypothetical protein
MLSSFRHVERLTWDGGTDYTGPQDVTHPVHARTFGGVLEIRALELG